MRRAEAGAYALVMAAQDLGDDNVRDAIDCVAWRVVLDIREIKKRWEALHEATRSKESPPSGDREKPTPLHLIEPDTA